ncbi:MAG: nascent polypeptide-associated complex protein [Candidatus Aenigmarchaeota archaeon]|nr:nascent polypeptide-associated complex protein [Candidatus Aenigmarchaeota archaeon]
MLPNLTPEKMEKLLKQLGITTEPIEAEEVIIKTKAGEIKIKNPEVVKTNIKGKIVFQVSGEFEEEPYTDDDIKLVMEESGCDDVELVKKTLKETNGDIVEAIMRLKQSTA